MAASLFDSALYQGLVGDAEIAKLFSDSAEIRALLLVEGALAKAQAKLGLIPEISAAAIHRDALEVVIDPAGLSDATGQNAVCVPALVAAFRTAMQAGDHAQYVHWGATSQDIMDTGLVLRLRQVCAILENRLITLTKALGSVAKTHATLPMAGRTYAQVATPTTFGAVVASWGTPLVRHLERLDQLRPRLLNVSLSGAAGTLSVMGEHGPAIRTELAAQLNLNDPGNSWHSNRDTMAELSAWATMVCASLGKIGEDLILLTQSGIAEIQLGTGGGSSTMPQKSNPVQPSILAAMANHTVGLNSSVQAAAVHRQQRDGSAWITEWLALPQICLATGRALNIATDIAGAMSPNPDAMMQNIDDGSGLIFAEALSFGFAKTMPRPDAQAAVKTLCKQTVETGTGLRELAQSQWPELDVSAIFDTASLLGTAPTDADKFAAIADALTPNN